MRIGCSCIPLTIHIPQSGQFARWRTRPQVITQDVDPPSPSRFRCCHAARRHWLRRSDNRCRSGSNTRPAAAFAPGVDQSVRYSTQLSSAWSSIPIRAICPQALTIATTTMARKVLTLLDDNFNRKGYSCPIQNYLSPCSLRQSASPLANARQPAFRLHRRHRARSRT